MDPGFQPGEIIEARIPRLTVDRVEPGEDGWVHVTYQDSMVVVELKLPVGTGVRFERVIPADGEPQPGELWADQVEVLYVAQLGLRGDSARLVDVDAQGSGHRWEDVHRGPTGPIYRVAQRPLIGGQS